MKTALQQGKATAMLEPACGYLVSQIDWCNPVLLSDLYERRSWVDLRHGDDGEHHARASADNFVRYG